VRGEKLGSNRCRVSWGCKPGTLLEETEERFDPDVQHQKQESDHEPFEESIALMKLEKWPAPAAG
jgi:hypothetical protein